MRSIVAALGMLAAAGAVQAGAAMNTISEQVRAESANGKVMVTLRVHNGTAAPLYVPKSLYQADQLFGPAFEVAAQGGAPLAYTGPMVKRGPLTKEDYLPVAPGATLAHSIDITPSYAFQPGTHTYVLRFAGSVVSNLATLQRSAMQGPPAVTFTHTSQ